MRICVIGTGYVGLVSAACLAELGHTITGVDIDEKKIACLKEGKSPIFEPGLEELIQRNMHDKRLSFTANVKDCLPETDVVCSAVATPPGEGHAADLKAVFAVTETVATLAEKDLVFVNKSTVPVGTGKECEKRIATILSERGVNLSIPVVSNPEFLREGMAVHDTLNPDRIIVGVNGEPTSSGKSVHVIMEDLFLPTTRVGRPLVFMSRESAEMVKYASNAFLATKISFINMLSELCEKTDANIRDVAKGIGLDSRIGPRFLHAGIGYGGSCFPKDVRALLATAHEYGIELPIVTATDAVNVRQRERFIEIVMSVVPQGGTIAVWGLSFKPMTDDMRDAPSLMIIPALLDAGYSLTAFDPVASENAKKVLPDNLSYASSAMDAVKNADALMVLTEWDAFRGIDLTEIKSIMKGNGLIDGRNIFDPNEVRKAGLCYHGIGMKE